MSTYARETPLHSYHQVSLRKLIQVGLLLVSNGLEVLHTFTTFAETLPAAKHVYVWGILHVHFSHFHHTVSKLNNHMHQPGS